jgi:hypothetical protein
MSFFKTLFQFAQFMIPYQTLDFSGVDFQDDFFFLSRTDEEYPVVCRTENEPYSTGSVDRGWRAFRIEGELDLSLTGILSKISASLLIAVLRSLLFPNSIRIIFW